MSQSDAHSIRSIRFPSAPRIRDNVSMQTTHSYIQAHRFVTPRSTRAITQPTNLIDPSIINIISSRSPNSNRIHKLLHIKPTSRKVSNKQQAQIFDRAYYRQRQRVITEVEQEESRKQQLRHKLGLTRKPKPCFYQFDRANLSYMANKIETQPSEGRYRGKLHPVCRLYDQYSQRVSMQPACLQNPFD